MVSGERKLEAWLKFLIGIAIILFLNGLVGVFFFRIDLTEEKRFSISNATKETLKNLQEPVYIEVYLTGDLNAEFKRFSTSIRETLEEFRITAGKNIQYRFIDPMSATSAEARNEYINTLVSKGIIPTDLYDSEDGKQITKRIFPGALVSYGGQEIGINLLKGNKGMSAVEQLNQSMEGVEFELVLAIRKLSDSERKKLALVHGHGELDSLEIIDFTNILLESYDVFKVSLPDRKNLLGYDAALIVNPRNPFSEFDKYKLDQFLMKGGKLVFMVESVPVNMDSVSGDGMMAFPRDVGLGDQLFRYGVRLNGDLVQDLNAGAHPVVIGNRGNQPQIKPLTWPYYIMANRYGDHPITKNLDAVYMKFAGTIDTVKAVGVKKTPLIYSSAYSRKLNAPVQVGLNSLSEISEEQFMNQAPSVMGVLLEGSFTSVFKNRFLPKEANETEFIKDGKPSKILVLSDGDFVKNEFNYRAGEPFGLGFDPVSGTAFANSDFIKNSMEYMLNEDGIINARRKEIRIRPLDKIRAEEEKLMWQLINLVLPLILILVFGFIKQMLRKRKYAQ